MERHTLIETKLVPTFVSLRILARDHLVDRLLDNAFARLIVVQGEAGAGKSSLVYAFTRCSPLAVAWYSLQETDQEPKVFLTYICGALERVYPGAVLNARVAIENVTQVESWEPLVVALINDLVQYGHRVCLVLDDFHVVQCVPQIADIMSFLVKNAPANLLLVIATRTSVNLRLSYLRAKGLLIEVTAQDLRFSSDEVEALFRDIWNIPIDRLTAELLCEKTEGWITGLQLVSQATRSRSVHEIRTYIEELQGKEQFIYDYLATEVYGLQSKEVCSFLKRTSILSRFNADLATYTSQDSHAEERMRHLETSRLFLVHLDSNREWFRYHHLFGDFLRRTLAIEDGPQEVRALHGLAGKWWEQHDEPASAIAHYIDAQDTNAAVRVLEQRGIEMLSQGLHKNVEVWLDALETSLQETNPTLLVLRGEARELSGDWTRAVDLYEKAIATFRAIGDNERAAAALESLLICYIRYGEVERLIQTCESALATCDPSDLGQRGSLSARMGTMLIYCGKDWERGYDLLATGHQLAYKSGDPLAIAWACVLYGFCYHFPQGNFLHAERAFNEGIELLRSLGWSPVLYQLLMNKAIVQIFKGDLGRAHDLIEDTIVVAQRGGHAFVVQALEMGRAMLYLELRDFHRCAQSFASLSERLVPAGIKPWYYRTLMLMYVGQGNMDQARVAAQEMMRVLNLRGYGMYAPECLVSLAWYYGRRQEYPAAERFLQQARLLSIRAQSRFWEMKSYLYEAALVRESHGKVHRLRESLYHALAITRENDYADFWLVDPLGFNVPLLVDAVGLRVMESYARELLSRWEDRLPELLAPLADGNNVRGKRVVLELLGKTGSPEHVALLKDACHDASESVRAVARRSLRKLTYEQPKVEIYCLGPLQVVCNGQPVDLRRRMTVRIFHYFLAYYNTPVASESVTDIFWPEYSPDKARHNLAVHINYLRKHVHTGPSSSKFLIALQRDGCYVLKLNANIWLDLAEFDRLFIEGEALQRNGDSEAARVKFLRAEALCRGDFLEGVKYDDEVQARRQRVAQQYRDIVTFLAHRATKTNAAGEAAAWYRKLLARDPLDETVVQHLLRCYAVMGDRTSAKRDFEAFCRALLKDMDMEPSSETLLLAKRMELQPS